jgi:addiction module RelE/StbE family toxin
MRIRWLPSAREDLLNAVTYIREDNPQAARRLHETVRKLVSNLSQFPQFGRAGRVEGTRELVIAGWPYIVTYRIEEREVQILAVMHTSRLWPESFDSSH